jgi:uncharacterized protein (TIGR00297 family)
VRRPLTETTRQWSDHPGAVVGLALGLAALAVGLWWGDGEAGRVVAGRLAIGLAGSLLIGLAGRRRGWLTTSGQFGAVLVGTLVMGGGGLTCGLLLIAFFLSSSLLSRRRQRQDQGTIAAVKGSQRDLGQVLANGGLAAALAGAAGLWPAPWLMTAFVGALASVTADTWSTEVGALSRRPPRLVTTGRVVPAGTYGAVSPLGTLAGAAGGLAIGLAALALYPLGVRLGEVTDQAVTPACWPLLGLVSGLGGGIVDSLLGATVQAMRWCPRCAAETEAHHHVCGTATRPHRGWSWLDNDRVNMLASLAGAALGAGLSALC